LAPRRGAATNCENSRVAVGWIGRVFHVELASEIESVPPGFEPLPGGIARTNSWDPLGLRPVRPTLDFASPIRLISVQLVIMVT
jgi:hypothetical protein